MVLREGRAKRGIHEGNKFWIRCFPKTLLSSRDEQRLQEEVSSLFNLVPATRPACVVDICRGVGG